MMQKVITVLDQATDEIAILIRNNDLSTLECAKCQDQLTQAQQSLLSLLTTLQDQAKAKVN